MVENISIDGFPSTNGDIECKWVAIQIEPILGSNERLTIGVAAINKDGFYLSQASQWDRLKCLYGTAADTVVFAARTALDFLNDDIAQRVILPH